MRKVVVETRARADLEQILRFIAMHNPAAAGRTLDRIGESISSLKTFSTGRPGRVPGTFEKVVPGLPYIVVYTIARRGDDEVATVILVHHTSRDYPSRDLPGDET